jgi:hypothetical protein
LASSAPAASHGLASWIVERVAEEDSTAQAATAAQIEAFRSDTAEQLASLRDEIAQLKRALDGNG